MTNAGILLPDWYIGKTLYLAKLDRATRDQRKPIPSLSHDLVISWMDEFDRHRIIRIIIWRECSLVMCCKLYGVLERLIWWLPCDLYRAYAICDSAGDLQDSRVHDNFTNTVQHLTFIENRINRHIRCFSSDNLQVGSKELSNFMCAGVQCSE